MDFPSAPALEVARAVDADRLWARHMRLAEIGATARGGVDRQALSGEEIEARRRLAAWAGELGLEVLTDDIANLFLRLPGQRPELAPVLAGSHIDSQPTGGRFDGVFGVLAALEAVAAMRACGVVPERPVEVVAWTNEEGSRFAPGMMGAQAFAAVWPLEEMLAVRDRDGISVREARDAVLAATPEIARRPLGFPAFAYLEPHIEQGPVLEREGKAVGIVTRMQGNRRFRVRVRGEAAHAGTTPMRERRDALMAAASMIGALGRAMADPDDVVRFTVGMLEVAPNAPSVVPESVLFSIDLRHFEADRLAALGDAVAPTCEAHAGPCAVEVREIARDEPSVLDSGLALRLRAAARALEVPHMDHPSAAGHDARFVARVCPTAMLFVPCRDGISHNEAEWAEPVDLAAGARVLAATLVDLACGG
jgi:beta-ureidopropionase / N-carbamoyl-L-amino-acid hydrolase